MYASIWASVSKDFFIHPQGLIILNGRPFCLVSSLALFRRRFFSMPLAFSFVFHFFMMKVRFFIIKKNVAKALLPKTLTYLLLSPFSLCFKRHFLFCSMGWNYEKNVGKKSQKLSKTWKQEKVSHNCKVRILSTPR